MLKIISPLAFVLGSVDMMVDTVSIGFIVDPFSIINIAINMREFTLAMSSIVLPLALILSTIWPLLNSESISESSNPLSVICGASLESICSSLFSLSIRVVLPVLRDSLS